MRNALGFDRELSCLWLWVVENLGPNNWFTVFFRILNMKRYIVLFVVLFFSVCANAQLEVKTDSFKEVPGFVNINLDIQSDDNDVPYAVVKVKTENINDKQRRELLFQGDAATFIECEYKVGEVWLYLTYKASYLKISHPDLSSTEFWFPFDMEPKKGYELTLVNKSDSNIVQEQLKNRIEELETINQEMQNEITKEPKGITNFITLNAAYNSLGDLSYGLTYGSYKKYGWFVSAMTNFDFNGFSSDYECDDNLMVGDYYPDYNGTEYHTNLSIMAGFIYKIAKPLTLKIGAGYGVRNTVYETTNNQLVKNKDVSATGLDISLGAMYKVGKFVVTLDAVTTNFKVFEARLGLGLGFLR